MQEKVYQQKTNNELILVLVLSALMAFASLSTDFYLPALPLMSESLFGNAELTVGGFLFGYALGQLFWGGISDKFGRKPPLFFALFIFIIGSVACAESQSISEIVSWRVVQAIGASCAPVTARAIVRDLFDKQAAATVFSTLTMIMTIVPITAPLIGGWILHLTVWNSLFMFLALIGFVMIFSICFITESLPQEIRTPVKFSRTFSSYKPLLLNYNFMRYAFCFGFYYTGIFAFIIASPFVYKTFGIDAQHYGYLFALNIFGVMAMSALNKQLLKVLNTQQILTTAIITISVAAVILAIGTLRNFAGLWFIVGLIVIIFSANGVIAACCTANALHQVSPQQAGSASAILGALQYVGGVPASLCLTLFGNSAAAMGVLICLFSLLSLFCILKQTAPKMPKIFKKKTNKKENNGENKTENKPENNEHIKA